MTVYKDVSTICMDLLETIISRDDEKFADYVYYTLSKSGYEIRHKEKVCVKIRQRYLEYSMGNFHNDYEYVSAICMSLTNSCVSDGIIRDISEHILDYYYLIDGAKEFLTLLHDKYRIVLASNFVEKWADSLLTRMEIDSLFDEKYISSVIKYRKPAPAFFEYIIQKEKGEAKEFCFIGNSFTNDYQGGISVGMNAILIRENNCASKEGASYEEIEKMLLR